MSVRTRARLLIVALAAASLLVPGAIPAHADHCPAPFDPWDPACHPTPAPPTPTPPPPTPTPPPATPQPTPEPQPEPEPEPTPAPAPGGTTQQATPPPQTGPTPTPAPGAATLDDDEDVDDLELEPRRTPEIVVQGPVLDDDIDPEGDTARLATEREETGGGGGASGWVLFIIGFVLGGVVGRASWGLQKKKKQQIFG